jgi:hypothetical protein
MDRSRIKGLVLGIVIAFAGAALAKTFGVFTPATGILVGNANSSTTTAATSTNVIGLWTGTCNSGTFLRADGSCQATTSVPYTNSTTFTPTCTGYAACPITANSAKYSVTGNIVCIYINNFGGTSNATDFTITIPPAAAQPFNSGSQGPSGYAVATNNATTVQSNWTMAGDGTGVIVFRNGATSTSSTSWTASGSKGLATDFNVCWAGANVP